METEPSEEEEEEKKKPSEEDRTSEKEEEKKSQLVKSCSWVGPSCVFNYKNVIELWVMKTENSQNVFSFHNS